MSGENTLPQSLEAAREDGELLESLVFDHAAAENLDFSELTCRQLSFRACRFSGCDFTAAAFYGCDFTGCRFTACRFPASYWKSCCLTDCKGDGGDFRRSRFKCCSLNGCVFPYANFCNAVWERCDLRECNFTESALAECKISKTTVQTVDLTGAELFHTSFKGMDISSCTLDRVSLSESCAELRGAKIHVTQAAVVARILGIEVIP